MEAREHLKLLLDLQGALIRSALPPTRSENYRTRKRISRRLERKCVAIAKRLRPEVVIEIGAHEATFSRHMREALPDSRVLAFEANDRVFAKYHPAVSALGVEYLNLCIAGRPGKVAFTVPITEDGRERHKMGSLLSHIGTQNSRSFEVDAVRLDDYLGVDLERPSVIWLDVEGAAGPVLEGSTRALAHCRALFAELETTPRWEGQATDVEVFEILAGHGLYPVIRDFQKPGQYNALFLRSEGARNSNIRTACRDFLELSTRRTPAVQPDLEKA